MMPALVKIANYRSYPLMPSALKNSYKSQSGFTLIEVMIIVVIIGILTAIGVIGYQNYIRKTQVMMVYEEINHYRIPYETLINGGVGVTGFSPNGLNMLEETKNCQFSVTVPMKDSATPNAVKCSIQNLPYLQEQTLSLDRTTDGKWQCKASAGIPAAYLPQACQ